MRAYVTEQKDLDEHFIHEEEILHIWEENGITYDWNEANARNESVNITVSPGMLNNRSVYAHVFFTMHGFSHNPHDSTFDARASIYKRCELTVHRAPIKEVYKRNLLEKINEEDEKLRLKVHTCIFSHHFLVISVCTGAGCARK